MNNKKKSPLYETPEWIREDPSYKKEAVKNFFDERILVLKNQQDLEIDFQSQSMEIINNSASNAGKSIIVLNGAAAIAVLTKIVGFPLLVNALLIYSWGASTGALVFVGTYLAQYYFRHHKNKIGTCFQILTILIFIIGFGLFIAGGYFTASALAPTIVTS